MKNKRKLFYKRDLLLLLLLFLFSFSLYFNFNLKTQNDQLNQRLKESQKLNEVSTTELNNMVELNQTLKHFSYIKNQHVLQNVQVTNTQNIDQKINMTPTPIEIGTLSAVTLTTILNWGGKILLVLS